MTQKFAEILLPTALDQFFTYSYEQDLKIGNIVNVEFGKRKIWGVVVNINITQAPKIDKIKNIIAINDNIYLNEKYITFISKLANYNMVSKGLVLKSFINILNSNKTKKEPELFIQNFNKDNLNLKELLPHQLEVAQNIFEEINKNKAQNFLIHGVTGCGKTEIYFDIIAKILANNNSQILILLPEIALTSQITMRFEQQFGFKAAIWHSKISAKNKREIYYALNSGNLRILIGARSALLLPFKNLQLIIIDEEHDSSFKQEDIFKFNARDMAIMLAKIMNFPTILTSATPAIESYNNALTNKFKYYHITKSFGSKNIIDIIDLTQEKLDRNKYLSNKLKDEIASNIASNKQSLLFINRRGYSPVTMCAKCGTKYQCLNCDSHLVLHKNKNKLICHYCNHQENFTNICKSCSHEGSIISLGIGVEKIVEEVTQYFPQARIACATSDIITNFDQASNLVSNILNNEIDIIIGTQMIAKGYDFPNLTLVGIIDIDSMLYSSELKALERVYQILNQVIGRSGRRSEKGKVIIQSYNPKNMIFNFIGNDDHKAFYNFEIKNRKLFDLPPFSRLAKIEVSAFLENDAKNYAKNIVTKFPINDKLELFGPAPAVIGRLRNRYYFIINIKAAKNLNLQKLISDIIDSLIIPSKIRIKIDIDPI
jgi:primosomal protein N' (replication factor Y)